MLSKLFGKKPVDVGKPDKRASIEFELINVNEGTLEQMAKRLQRNLSMVLLQRKQRKEGCKSLNIVE